VAHRQAADDLVGAARQPVQHVGRPVGPSGLAEHLAVEHHHRVGGKAGLVDVDDGSELGHGEPLHEGGGILARLRRLIDVGPADLRAEAVRPEQVEATG
ncbi:uncharacterized protein METZ01_LOCUS34588, partial [marine metagenome]